MWISDLSRGVPGTMLKLFVAGELIAWGASTFVSLALYNWVLRSPWLLVLALICVMQSIIQGVALRLALQHRDQQTVTVMCVGNWAGALLVTFVAPMFLPVVAL